MGVVVTAAAFENIDLQVGCVPHDTPPWVLEVEWLETGTRVPGQETTTWRHVTE
jgi:hypothetical protein